jgi:hypothetical protein
MGQALAISIPRTEAAVVRVLSVERHDTNCGDLSAEVFMTEVTDWLTAIGTCGAVVVSLGLALKELRDKRKRDERHQAELVTAWFVPYEGPKDDEYAEYSGLRVHNASDQLIYDVVAEVLISRKTAVNDTEERNIAFGAMVGNVPPGGFTARINTGGGAMGRRHLVEFAFQDAASRYWLRHANGKLERVRKHPVDLFNIPRPVRWQTEPNY